MKHSSRSNALFLVRSLRTRTPASTSDCLHLPSTRCLPLTASQSGVRLECRGDGGHQPEHHGPRQFPAVCCSGKSPEVLAQAITESDLCPATHPTALFLSGATVSACQNYRHSPAQTRCCGHNHCQTTAHSASDKGGCAKDTEGSHAARSSRKR